MGATEHLNSKTKFTSKNILKESLLKTWNRIDAVSQRKKIIESISQQLEIII